jgi:hypothetical protein
MQRVENWILYAINNAELNGVIVFDGWPILSEI